jgi:endonuclease/exonuclease/phosphatase (EEP) superfamily protein YafD
VQFLSKISRAILATIAAMALAVAAIGLLAHFVPVDNHITLIAAALAPYLMLGAPISLVIWAATRRGILAVTAVAFTCAALFTQLPLYSHSPEGDHRASATIRLLTANLYLGQADAASIVSTATTDADVVALQELTPAAVKRLSAAGLDAIFPFHMIDARDEGSGVGLFSRFPVSDVKRVPGYTLAMVSVRIKVAGVTEDPTVIVVHMTGPWPQAIDGWVRDLRSLPETLNAAATAEGSGCVIAAGDYNSTADMRNFRDVTRAGYRDAAEQAGAGIIPTYPGNVWAPPLIAIDHVLTHGCTATAVRAATLPGSDHRGLIAQVRVPDGAN